MNLQQIFSSYKTNITIDIPPRVIVCFFGNSSFVEKLESLNLKLQYHISPLHSNEYQTDVELNAYLVNIAINEIIGRFTISCISKPEKSHIIFTSLTISIGDEDREDLRIYLKKGLARLIMGVNLQIFYNIFQNEDKNLIIDADASEGFWETIGMTDTPRGADDDRTGYDKFVLLKDVYRWVFKKECQTEWCMRSFHNLFVKSKTTAKGKRRKAKKTKKRRKRRSKRI
jgi:hypothetical protein